MARIVTILTKVVHLIPLTLFAGYEPKHRFDDITEWSLISLTSSWVLTYFTCTLQGDFDHIDDRRKKVSFGSCDGVRWKFWLWEFVALSLFCLNGLTNVRRVMLLTRGSDTYGG